MKKFLEIIENIKDLKGLKVDREVAKILKLSDTAFYNHKSRGSIPTDSILAFCETEDISSDWLLLGHASTPPSPAVDRITRWLKEHPDDAEAILKIIEGREAMERLKKG